MTQFESDMQAVRTELINMWELVYLQLSKAKESLINFDKDLAREVVQKEKRVNAYELKIDRDCENIFALFCPVAVDLRFLLAVLKINNNLERIGDIADGIAKYIVDSPIKYDRSMLETAEVIRMFDDSLDILKDTRVAFENENTLLARTIFSRDEVLDDINRKADQEIAKYIQSNPQNINEALSTLSIIRKLERVGDQSKNIAEEIIFYIEAKVLKHFKSS
ncbi:MAG: phosphate transport system regulatory protein PhoU [Bacteroidetes bacterium]|nr:MAG: phosphate transport system regulatory protein PhoU [Bacteroidota bacterium]